MSAEQVSSTDKLSAEQVSSTNTERQPCVSRRLDSERDRATSARRECAAAAAATRIPHNCSKTRPNHVPNRSLYRIRSSWRDDCFRLRTTARKRQADSPYQQKALIIHATTTIQTYSHHSTGVAWDAYIWRRVVGDGRQCAAEPGKHEHSTRNWRNPDDESKDAQNAAKPDQTETKSEAPDATTMDIRNRARVGSMFSNQYHNQSLADQKRSRKHSLNRR
jgi:hypothetical protein